MKFPVLLISAIAPLPVWGEAQDPPKPNGPPPVPIQELQIPGGGMLRIEGGGQLRIQGGAQLQIRPLLGVQAAGNEKEDAEGGTPWLGVQMEATSNLELEEDEKPPPGVGIISVMENSPASKAGLKATDRVLKINETVLKNEQDLRNTVRAMKPGAEVKVVISRDEKEQELKVVLEKMPAQLNQQLQLFDPLDNGNRKPATVRFFNAPVRIADGAGPDVVHLRDGNRLEGKVISVSETEIRLKLEAGGDVPLEAAGVQTVRISGGRTESLPVALLLRNGGWIACRDATLDHGKFTAQLSTGETWTIPREKVDSMGMLPGGVPVFYRGPRDGDGWAAWPEGSWKFASGEWRAADTRNGGFGFVGRKFHQLPDAFEFSFDVAGLGLNPMQVVLGGQRNTADDSYASPGAIRLQLSSGSVSISQFDGMRFFNNLPPVGGEAVEFPPQQDKRPRHIVLYWKRSTGMLAVAMDDRVVGRFEVAKITPGDLPKAGRVLRIMAASPDMKIRNVLVQPWLGQLPREGIRVSSDLLAAETEPDWLEENIERITPAEITLAKSGSRPRNGAHLLAFVPSALPGPSMPVKVWLELKNGSAFPAESIASQNGKFLIHTSFAGDLVLAMTAVRALDFRHPDKSREGGADQLDVLTFADGRQLRGTFDGSLQDGRLRWKLSAAKVPLEFPTESAATLLLAARPDVKPVEGSQVVRLTNGDWLAGEIAATDADSITWKCALHDQLKLSLNQVRTLFPSAAASVTADAASGRKPWRVRQGNSGIWINGEMLVEDEDALLSDWQYSNGTYSVNGKGGKRATAQAIALPLPALDHATSVEFSIHAANGWFAAQILGKGTSGVFSIYCSGNALQVVRTVQTRNANGIFMRPEQLHFDLPPSARNADGIRHQVIFDPDNKCIHFACNGTLLGTSRLKDSDKWPEIRAITFSNSYGNGGPFSVADVWITPWNGKLGTPGKPTAGQVSLFLANGDEATGRLIALKPSLLELECDAGEVPLPLSRVQAVEFSRPEDAAQPLYVLRLFDRGRLSATALHIRESSLTASTVLGEITLPLAAVKEIVFVQPAAK